MASPTNRVSVPEQYEHFVAWLASNLRTARKVGSVKSGGSNRIRGLSGVRHQVDVSFIDSSFAAPTLGGSAYYFKVLAWSAWPAWPIALWLASWQSGQFSQRILRPRSRQPGFGCSAGMKRQARTKILFSRLSKFLI